MPSYTNIIGGQAKRGLTAENAFKQAQPTPTPIPEANDIFAGLPSEDPFVDFDGNGAEPVPMQPAGVTPTPDATHPESEAESYSFKEFLNSLASGVKEGTKSALQTGGDIVTLGQHGATFGLDTYLAGLGEGIAGIGDKTDKSTFGDRFKRGHQKQMQEVALARERSPFLGFAAELGSGIGAASKVMTALKPTSNLAKLGINVGMGAGQSALESKNPVFEDPQAAAFNASIGGGVSLAVPAAGEAIKKTLRGVNSMAPWVAEKAINLTPKEKNLYSEFLNDPSKWEEAKNIRSKFSDDILGQAKQFENFKTGTYKAAMNQYAEGLDTIKGLPEREIYPLKQSYEKIKQQIAQTKQLVETNPKNYNFSNNAKDALEQMNDIAQTPPKDNGDLVDKLLRLKRIAKKGTSFKSEFGTSPDFDPNKRLFDGLEKGIRTELHSGKNYATQLISEMDAQYAPFMESFENINKVLGTKGRSKIVDPVKFENIMTGKGSNARQAVTKENIDRFAKEADSLGLKSDADKIRYVREKMRQMQDFSRISAKSGETTGKSLATYGTFGLASPFVNPRWYLDAIGAAKGADQKLAELTKYAATKNNSALKNAIQRIQQTMTARKLAPEQFDQEFNKIYEEEAKK